MKVLENLRYAEGHEWVRVEGNRAYVGITDFAQDELGDIVYVEFEDVDSDYEVGDIVASVESVKAASDIYAPVSGKLVEVNENLDDSPELINEDSYENWMFCIEMADESDLDKLMNAEEYRKFSEEGA